MSTSSTLTRTLAAALARHADRSFGLMGNGNAHLIECLADAGVPYTAVRHEAGTVAAADAYARVSGKLAIATTTYGAGFTNTLTALAEAAQARIPMLVVVGDAPSSGPRPWDVDQEMLAAALGVRTHMLTVTNIDRTVDRAVSYAMRFRRPVVLAIPYDLVTAEVAAPAAATPSRDAEATTASGAPGAIDLNDPAVLAALTASVAGTAVPAPAPVASDGGPIAALAGHQLEAAARALLEAERPLVLAGRGAHVAGAGAELGRVADLLGALTSTTALARGIFPAAEFDLGVTGGFGQIPAMEVVAQADVVLVVGAALNQFTMRFGDLFGAGTTVIRIDAEQVAAPKTNQPITHLLLQGDAKATLTTLLGALEDASGRAGGWRERVAGLEAGGALRVRGTGLEEHPDGICADGRLDPRAVAARIGELLPADRHVTTDGGHFLGWANMYWPVASPERMVMVGTAYQTIGLGFSTVAGVAAAAPESTTVLSTGDGGGLMALADLETAIRTAKSGVIVVWNDGAYGAEVHLYGVMGLDEAPMLIPDVDFAALGSALGAQGVRVASLSDLDALAEWTAAGATGTILLDCRVSRSVVAEYQREIQRVNGLTPPTH
ncbi:thiamine pyrophosphate-binding protein [Leucobacter chromiireducens]|uniref:thiamine pyrophosphate-binding protein n=1 Tax=Leucobacter chromiireducens TaxID=283877 RepID=UPI000F633EB2|nr:thiamine pyrophosphate-binding protein [Leucobacter chromiireducens]